MFEEIINGLQAQVTALNAEITRLLSAPNTDARIADLESQVVVLKNRIAELEMSQQILQSNEAANRQAAIEQALRDAQIVWDAARSTLTSERDNALADRDAARGERDVLADRLARANAVIDET